MAWRTQVLCISWILVSIAGCHDVPRAGDCEDVASVGDDAGVLGGIVDSPPVPTSPISPPTSDPDAGASVVSPPVTEATSDGRITAPNPIPAENALEGDPLWRAGSDAGRNNLELYTSTESAVSGESVAVKVSVRVLDQPVTASVYRLGYYGGAGARKVWSGGPYSARTQPACPRDSATSLVECQWDDTFQFTVGQDWVSGLYLVKVTQGAWKRFAPFVVRDNRAADVLFAASFLNYQAYNSWGGENLYSSESGMPQGRAYMVSFDRPYNEDEGSGQLLRWEYPLARFLESRGYDVTYATNVDFVRSDKLLSGIGAFVHGGHDEYWPTEERTQVDAALATGRMSLAHFGANSAYWRVRLGPSAEGTPHRTVVCYKSAALDPQPGSTVRFRDDPNRNPENALFGSMYDGWQLASFPLAVANPAHWLLENTGLTRGDTLPGLVGYEFDRIFEDPYTPPGVQVSFESPVLTTQSTPNRSQVVDRTLPSGRLVFSSGTIYWSLALSDDPSLRDGRVEQMTQNVLNRAICHRPNPSGSQRPSGPPAPRPTPDGAWARSVTAFAGTAGAGGHRDGPAVEARFNGPTALAVAPDGKVFVADTLNNDIRLIDNDSEATVSTVAGTGAQGQQDGIGTSASFRRPTGLALASDGTLYIADSENHCIRRMVRTPQGWQVSTYAGALRVSGFADGAGPDARFNRPSALALSAQGDLYVADQSNNRIRVIHAATGVVATVAGTAAAGNLDSTDGLRAQFYNPSAVAVAADGSVYVLDAGNQRVRRIAPNGTRAVTSLAGGSASSQGFADGLGTQARFRAQMGLALDAAGNLVLADGGNYRLRKIVPGADAATTRVQTLAGSGRLGLALGSGAEADLVTPAGVAWMPNTGAILAADPYHNVIRRIDP